MPDVTCMFSCHKCNLLQKKFDVRERFENEDIIKYTGFVMTQATKIHRLFSPICVPKALDLYLPVSDKGIGSTGPELSAEDREYLRKQLEAPPDKEST